MKAFYITTIILTFFLISCGDSGKKDSEQEVKETTDITEPPKKQENLYHHVRTLLPELPTTKFPQTWDFAYLEKMEMQKGLQVDGNSFQNWYWLLNDEEIYKGSEPLNFFWKHQVGNSYLLCFSTFVMYTKGGDTEYYLALVQKDEIEPIYHLKDMINFAAFRTGMGGIKVKLAEIDGTGMLVESYSPELEIYQVNSEKILLDKSLISYYADDYMKPQMTTGKLVDVVNNIDFITYSFETPQGQISFNHMTNEFTVPGTYFMEDTTDTESVVATYLVNPDMQKEFAIRYEKVYEQEFLNEDYSEDNKLTGLADISSSLEDFPKMRRSIYGIVLKVYKNDVWGFEILLRENQSNKEYVFTMPFGVFDDVMKDDYMHFAWEWQKYPFINKEDNSLARQIVEILPN